MSWRLITSYYFYFTLTTFPKSLATPNSIYTDDSGQGFQNRSMFCLKRALGQHLEAFNNWLRDNKLSLNAANTQSMGISVKQTFAVLKSQTEQSKLHIRHKDQGGAQPLSIFESV